MVDALLQFLPQRFASIAPVIGIAVAARDERAFAEEPTDDIVRIVFRQHVIGGVGQPIVIEDIAGFLLAESAAHFDTPWWLI